MHLTELEMRLSEDHSGDYQRQTIAMLAVWRYELGIQLLFSDTSAKRKEVLLLCDGCKAVITVVEKLATKIA
jgi:hypothetical protein